VLTSRLGYNGTVSLVAQWLQLWTCNWNYITMNVCASAQNMALLL